MAFYELLILGKPEKWQMAALADRLTEAAQVFDLDVPSQLAWRSADQASHRERKAATAAVFFGGDLDADGELVAELQADEIPVIPVVAAGTSFNDQVPDALRSTNGYFIPDGDDQLEALAAVLLESVGLLHEQRRVFVSYRRTESREVAVQLHDLLSARNFDVFLDTHDIRPGKPFQEMLWHRLVDCDLVIVLDTPDYFGSKWTTQEFGRALAKGIHILRLIWPGHAPSRHLSLADSIPLSGLDFTPDNRLTAASIGHIVQRAERLRSRSIATRHLEIAGKLRLEIERIGGRFEGIGAHRSISLSLPSGRRVWAYPAVGIPTADILNDVQSKAEKAVTKGFPLLIYDHVGIRDAWLDHLKWLDTHISAVRALRVMDAAWELVAWDN
ncbi:toll/interleukin-1 receptor domain-containing protein [Sphingomonas sp. HDW15A]|uniref:toll/interleukin-1 receptor domain-containing protein n=1 Tax=Sphingomonas sp. HDW15A TaxID=2714942 RepID=UPI001407F049|nr:toll/interleukin-1 receptor domain-containing protein [Sphingomonas sp. HDW15A]QIK95583.1 toll/interleukin-1 receptor domain-containing protein [Sphingomonas sp. HDW15A]